MKKATALLLTILMVFCISGCKKRPDNSSSGVSVFDAGHYHTENVIVNPLCLELSDKFSEVKFAKFDNENIKTV